MPAEWSGHEYVWVSRPHRPDTWPGCLEQAQQQFDRFVELLSSTTKVCDTQSLGIATDDSWVRDYGPIFVVNARGELACHDFRFNSWGQKYPPWDRDDAAAALIAKHANVPVQRHEQVLEGGAIDVNGAGTVLTTERCILHEKRNPGMSRPRIEQLLHEALGASHVIWLPGGIAGDDTDGHVDCVARFIGPTTIAAVRAPADHTDHAPLERNWQTLQNARDANGRRFDLVALPSPQLMHHDYPPDTAYDSGRAQLPATYANFLISNGAVYVPTFGQPADELALRTLDDAMSHHRIVPLRSEHLIVGQGALHCLTMQQPAARP